MSSENVKEDIMGASPIESPTRSAARVTVEDVDRVFADARSHDSRDGGQSVEVQRKSITLRPGELPDAVDAAELVLVANAEQLRVFQRGGEIVRMISLTRQGTEKAKKLDRLKRPEGALILHALNRTALQEIFDRLIAFESQNSKGKATPKDCPYKIASYYSSRVGFWKLPGLVGVIEAPIVAPDGTVLTAPGFDPSTGLFLSCGSEWPAMPENPTRADAETALRVLMEPFSEFPFLPVEDKSVLLAAILTALQRRLLNSAPLFAFSAPSQRSGKTLQVEAIGIIATGRIPAAYGISQDSEELRKAITSILREGHLIAHLDNIVQPLDSPYLARAVTTPLQGFYADRLLGTNCNLRLMTNVMWTATGNNLTFKGDMSTRALLARIDAKVERPEERSFRIPDLHAHLLQNREQLVMAALTILRAYHLAGRPRQQVKPWGGFDEWSREIREPIVWLGCADPCMTRDRITVDDPERGLIAEVLRQWHEAFGDRPKLTREVIDAARQDDRRSLCQALLLIAAEKNDPHEIDARRLGKWCAGVADRIIEGLSLSRERQVQRAQAWRVSDVSLVSSKPANSNDNSDGNSHFASHPAETNSPNSHNSSDGVEI